MDVWKGLGIHQGDEIEVNGSAFGQKGSPLARRVAPRPASAGASRVHENTQSSTRSEQITHHGSVLANCRAVVCPRGSGRSHWLLPLSLPRVVV